MEERWTYEKLDEEGNIKYCPMNDAKGEITEMFIINLPAYFDENPEERIRLGWIKHIEHSPKEVEYNKQTQYLQRSYKQIDEHTIEDVYHVLDKVEEMFLFEEMAETLGYTGGGIVFAGLEGNF